MIVIFENFEWTYFQENVYQYLVSGRLMTEPCPVTGDPIIHDIKIDEVWDCEQEKDLTRVIGHDYFTDILNNRIL